jgi:hypothetical protein
MSYGGPKVKGKVVLPKDDPELHPPQPDYAGDIAEQDKEDARQAERNKLLDDAQTSKDKAVQDALNTWYATYMQEMAGGYAEQLSVMNEGMQSQVSELKKIADLESQRREKEIALRRSLASKEGNKGTNKARVSLLADSQIGQEKGKTLLGV